MKTNIIYNKSCISMPEIDDNSVDCIITSPPYWGLRDYGVADQIGLEPTLKEYIDKLFIVTAECKRVLKPTGVMWWVHGDCYGGSGHGTSSKAKVEDSKESYLLPFGKNVTSKSTPKCLALQNFRLLIHLIDEQGWILRNTIIWSKPNGMPSSVKDRLANKYEPFFMLVKNKKYWFDLDAIREPSHTKRWGKNPKYEPKHSGLEKQGYNPSGKNPGDVWIIPTQPYPEAHFATFPEKLILKPILSSCPEGGITLDPFAGSGTTLAIAHKYHRQYIGYEVNPKYLKFIHKRIAKEDTLFNMED